RDPFAISAVMSRNSGIFLASSRELRSQPSLFQSQTRDPMSLLYNARLQRVAIPTSSTEKRHGSPTAASLTFTSSSQKQARAPEPKGSRLLSLTLTHLA